MQAIAPRVPWWSVVVCALVMTASLGVLHALGCGTAVRMVVLGVILLVFVAGFVRGPR